MDCTVERGLFTDDELREQARRSREGEREEQRNAEMGSIEAELNSVEDPIERLIRTVTACSAACSRPASSWNVSLGQTKSDTTYDAIPELVYTHIFVSVFPESFTNLNSSSLFGPTKDDFQWSHARPEQYSPTKLSAWFAAQANSAGVPKIEEQLAGPKLGFTGRPKTGREWGDGSKSVVPGDMEPVVGWPVGKRTARHSHRAFIREDGSFLTGEWVVGPDGRIRASGSLCLRAMFVMGLLLGYRTATGALQPNQLGIDLNSEMPHRC